MHSENLMSEGWHARYYQKKTKKHFKRRILLKKKKTKTNKMVVDNTGDSQKMKSKN